MRSVIQRGSGGEVILRMKQNMTSSVRDDCHSSFKALKEDKILKDLRINLQLRIEKNKNKNGVYLQTF